MIAFDYSYVTIIPFFLVVLVLKNGLWERNNTTWQCVYRGSWKLARILDTGVFAHSRVVVSLEKTFVGR